MIINSGIMWLNRTRYFSTSYSARYSSGEYCSSFAASNSMLSVGNLALDRSRMKLDGWSGNSPWGCWLRSYSSKKKPSLESFASNRYEQSFISQVVRPDEIGIKFDDVGALECVKKAMHELVILPITRPELFSHGNLLRPCKGLLLFGPPGTGKTLIAKALATEAKANFMNVTTASLTSMNLCIAAAYRPVEELLEEERKGNKLDGVPSLRPLKLDDFIRSKAKVRPSVSYKATSLIQLKEWNEQYGEGGGRKRRTKK